MKMQQEGSKNDRKNVENQCPGIKKSRKMGTRDASLQEATKRVVAKKTVDPSNSIAPFLQILMENGNQNGGPNPLKSKELIQKLKILFDRLLNAFLEEFWKQNGRNIDAKTMSKTCWNQS